MIYLCVWRFRFVYLLGVLGFVFVWGAMVCLCVYLVFWFYLVFKLS